MAKKTTVSTDKLLLEVQIRTLLGKKAKRVRRDNKIPANIFGPDFKSQSIMTDFLSFIHTYKIAKETGIIYLKLDGKEIPVLIKNIQKHPVNESILHVDFRKIDLAKKIETIVPIKTNGVSIAVTQLGGILLTQSESLLVEALPENIPQSIEIDISVLKVIGQQIKVSDLKKSEKYLVKTPAEKVILSVVEHKEESITPETTTVAPEVIGEVKEGVEVAPTTTGTAAPAAPGTPTPGTKEAGKETKKPEGKK